MTAGQALRTLLQRRGLEFEQVSERTVRVRPTTPSQPRKSDSARVEPTEGEPVTLPELLVRGSRSLNADIHSDNDDPQPYAIFHRTHIQRSGGNHLTD